MNRVAAATRIGVWNAYLINANTPTLAAPEAFMSWSFNIGRIAGTAILVHVTFVLFLGWIFVASWVAGGPESAWQALAFMLLLFACVVAHEFGHIFTARAFGVTAPAGVRLPIGGGGRPGRVPEGAG